MSADPLPRNFLRPCVLLLLREHPSYGYDLLERLPALGFERGDPGRLYRTLRGLEADGLVVSAWAASPEGPDRRVYRLTRSGMEELHRVSTRLVQTKETVDVFLSRYEEFVALDSAGARVSSRL